MFVSKSFDLRVFHGLTRTHGRFSSLTYLAKAFKLSTYSKALRACTVELRRRLRFAKNKIKLHFYQNQYICHLITNQFINLREMPNCTHSTTKHYY